VSDEENPRTLAAGLLRELGHEFVARDVDDETLKDVATRIETILAEVRTAPGRVRESSIASYDQFHALVPEHGTGQPRQLWSDSVVSGAANPMGLGAYLWRDGDQAVMEVTLGKAFEGAPTRAHGGIVAALIDETMGLVLAINRTMAYTAQLNVAYRAPTPVLVPLIARAWLERRDGRKLSMRATVTAGDVVAVEADALFIAVETFAP